MDAFTQEGLAGLQRGLEIEQVKRNVAEVVRRYGGDCLYLNYTLHSRNHRQLADFCRFAAELGISEVYATGLKVYEGYEDRLRPFRLTDTPELRASLAEAAEVLEAAGIPSGGIRVGEDRWEPGCFSRRRASPLIDVDGSVTFCSGREDVTIGNILDPGIEAVWADMAARLARCPEGWCARCHGKALPGGAYTLPGTIDREALRRQLEAERGDGRD